MSEGREVYNPNKTGTIDVKKMADEFGLALKTAHADAIKGLRTGLAIEFSEKAENRFADLLDLDYWEVPELLELSSMFFAIAIMQRYEKK